MCVDLGGPRREFFRLFAHEGKDHFFIGPDTKKFFITNVTAIQVYIAAGKKPITFSQV